jgi:hypothetical protein
LLDREPKLDTAAVRDLLTSTARDPSHQGRNDQLGFGIIDPLRALEAVDAKVAHDRFTTPPATPASAAAGPISAR